MKKYLIIAISIILFFACEDKQEEPLPLDCAGVEGGTATVDNCGTCDSDITNDCVVTNKDILINMGWNQPKNNPQQEYIAGLDIPTIVEQEFWEIQNDLNDIIGGYDRYLMLIYSENSNQENTQPVFDRLKEVGYWENIDLTLDDTDKFGCLNGVGYEKTPIDPYDLCILPYEWVIKTGNHYDPNYTTEAKIKAIVYHGWGHEYFHSYQLRYFFDKHMGSEAPYWWIEGSAVIFPDLWLRNNWDKFSAFSGLTFDDVAVAGMDVNETFKFQRRNIMGIEYGSNEIPEEELFLGTKDENYETGSYWFIGTANAHLASLTSYETIWISIPQDAYELGFEESFSLHVGMTLQEFYDVHKNLMRQGHHDDDPPNGFYPEGDIKEYVDFWE